MNRSIMVLGSMLWDVNYVRLLYNNLVFYDDSLRYDYYDTLESLQDIVDLS